METKGKILVVLDQNCKSNRTEEDFIRMKSVISSQLLSNGYEPDFSVFTSFVNDFDYDIDADSVMKKIDLKSTDICIDDYICVIAEGVSAWFWMQSAYKIPVISINPLIVPKSEFNEYISDSLNAQLQMILSNRGFHTDCSFCLLSSDDCFEGYEYEDVFCNDAVTYTEDPIDSPEFWGADSELIRLIHKIESSLTDE